jgi:hypothetical protein
LSIQKYDRTEELKVTETQHFLPEDFWAITKYNQFFTRYNQIYTAYTGLKKTFAELNFFY